MIFTHFLHLSQEDTLHRNEALPVCGYSQNTLMLGAVHEHKQALAWQALSHAKGHYLAAVSFNRSVAGWETDPGSVPSLRGCTIWQLQHICMSAVRACAHTLASVQVFVCQGGGIVYQTPSEKSPRYRLCHYSVHLAYYLSGFVCVCLCACVFVCMCVTAL